MDFEQIHSFIKIYCSPFLVKLLSLSSVIFWMTPIPPVSFYVIFSDTPASQSRYIYLIQKYTIQLWLHWYLSTPISKLGSPWGTWTIFHHSYLNFVSVTLFFSNIFPSELLPFSSPFLLLLQTGLHTWKLFSPSYRRFWSLPTNKKIFLTLFFFTSKFTL